MEVIITNRIERRRREAGLSQKELASMADVTQSTISMIENGDRTPSLAVITRLAAALRCTVDDLIEKPSA